MTLADDKVFNRILIEDILRMAFDHAYPAVASASSQLAAAMRMDVQSNTTGRLYIPHYWAVYMHDGRGPFGPRRGRYLVWWSNPLKDPRLDMGRSPQRWADVKHLTKDQWDDALTQNREAIRRGLPPPVHISLYVRTPTPGKFFFSNSEGMLGFFHRVRDEVKQQFRDYAKQDLRDVLKLEGSCTIGSGI